jgi:hypothetical protein
MHADKTKAKPKHPAAIMFGFIGVHRRASAVPRCGLFGF